MKPSSLHTAVGLIAKNTEEPTAEKIDITKSGDGEEEREEMIWERGRVRELFKDLPFLHDS
jgi:hypothetical protein